MDECHGISLWPVCLSVGKELQCEIGLEVTVGGCLEMGGPGTEPLSSSQASGVKPSPFFKR